MTADAAAENLVQREGEMMTKDNAGLIAEAQRIAALCPRSDASRTFMGLIDALEAASLTAAEDLLYVRRMEVERDAVLAVVEEAFAQTRDMGIRNLDESGIGGGIAQLRAILTKATS